jgi:hypothetical protein
LVRKPERKDHSGELGVDEKIILEWIVRETEEEDVDLSHVDQDRDQWRDIENTVMNF